MKATVLSSSAGPSSNAIDNDGFNKFPIKEFQQLEELNKLMENNDAFNKMVIKTACAFYYNIHSYLVHVFYLQQVNFWIPQLKKIIDSKQFKKSSPAGHVLLSSWFESREFFTNVVYKGKSKDNKPKIESLAAFLKVLQTILSSVDKNTYENGVKEFLQDYIKYAPRSKK